MIGGGDIPKKEKTSLIEDDSLSLSGETGTKIKTEIIKRYYRFWLSVVTRGDRGIFADKVHIIEMNAGTGQVKIDGVIHLGSAGHSLDLRYGRYKNEKLHIALIEPREDCRASLRKVIINRWPEAELHPYKNGWERSIDTAVNLFESSDLFLKYMKLSGLGNSLFFFDPLLAPDQSLVEKIASARVTKPFKTGTEFLIFFFTSDWVTGREEFTALPTTIKNKWTAEEQDSANTANHVFGNKKWQKIVSSGKSKKEIEEDLVVLYKQSLRRWFRYVQPLPFVPKKDQRYDVFCCSNYDVGMSVISKIYGNLTWDFGLQANLTKDRTPYDKFCQLHPELIQGLGASERPAEWKVLWHIIKNHIDGFCDPKCKGGIIQKLDRKGLGAILDWSYEQDYLNRVEIKSWSWPKSLPFPMYTIDWDIVKSRLNVDSPIPPRALEPGDLDKVRIKKKNEKKILDDGQTSLSDFF